jgi:hypothetical protein
MVIIKETITTIIQTTIIIEVIILTLTTAAITTTLAHAGTMFVPLRPPVRTGETPPTPKTRGNK